MRIASLKATNIPPVVRFEADQLGDVVIIAGANGAGKTRLKEAIIDTFRSAARPLVEITVQSTRPEVETEAWGGDRLTLTPDEPGVAGSRPRPQPTGPNKVFNTYMTSRTRGGTYTGSVIQIDSNRSVQPISFTQITLATPDPDDEELANTFYLEPFVGRWQNTVNKIFQKVANRDHKIAQYVKENPEGRNAEALERFPDPFIPYIEVFGKLLPGKSLEPIDPKQPREFHYRVGESVPLPFSTLSSGEQEVVRIVFDLIWKQIRHCVIFVDEPELHLHPTLAFRLIETLKGVGNNTNQFFFFTHSADLLSTYYSSGNVFFIDVANGDENQGKRLSALDQSHLQTARAMGANLGLFAVGKKLVFVEGEEASIDRLTYHKIAQTCFPEAYIFPARSVQNILSLNRFSEELQRSVFGIDFFMIRDRDGLTKEQIQELQANPRFKCLRRRHIENYFLDSEVLAHVGTQFYLDVPWRDELAIEQRLLDIAHVMIDQAALLGVKNFIAVNGSVDVPRVAGADARSAAEIQVEVTRAVQESMRVLETTLSREALEQRFTDERAKLERSLRTNAWKSLFPGKLIFASYCGRAGQQATRMREAYIDIALARKPEVFQPVREILEAFRDFA